MCDVPDQTELGSHLVLSRVEPLSESEGCWSRRDGPETGPGNAADVFRYTASSLQSGSFQGGVGEEEPGSAPAGEVDFLLVPSVEPSSARWF